MLADHATYSGFYQVSPPGTAVNDLLEANGRRAAFGQLFSFLRLSEDEMRTLADAHEGAF